MEKIKSLLSHGQDQPEVAQPGTVSENTTNTTPHHSSGLTGEGSHFGSVKDSSTTDQHRSNEYSSVDPSGYGATQGVGAQSSSTTGGPHSSNIGNKADPRVDSDNSRIPGSGLAGTSGASAPGTQGVGIQSSSATAGPHSSNLANKADPRVDSDNSRLVGSTGGYTSTSGGSYHTGPTGSAVGNGPHSTETENRLDRSVNQGATGGLGQSNTGYDTNTSSSGHNYGRDAAIGAGGVAAAGLAGHESGKQQSQTSREVGNDPAQEPDVSHMPGSFPSGPGLVAQPESSARGAEYGSTVQPGNDNTARNSSKTSDLGEPGAPAISGIPEHARATNDPLPSAVETRVDPTRDSHNDSTSKDHHYGRDAALAGGAAGVAGAAYGVNKHHGNDNTTTSTAGTHGSDLANRTDSGVDSDRSRDLGVSGAGYSTQKQTQAGGVATTTTTHTSSSTAGPHSSNIANEADPRIDSDRSKEHHYGRDAALVGGAGAGAYGATKLHDSKTTAGPHSSDTANKADPTVDSDRSKDHHYGRDAALVGGAGAGATKLHDSKTTAGPHSSDTANKVDPSVDSDRSKDHHYGRDAALVGGAGAGATKLHDSKTTAGPHSSDTANKVDPSVDSDRSKDHHYGRDAAVVGGAGGAAAYGAHKYNERDDKDLKKAEKEQEKQHEKHEKKSGGFLSFLHRDKNKKYSKEEEDDFDRQERDHNSNKGRDAALGAGVGTAAAGGAYAAHQHESGHGAQGAADATTNKSLPVGDQGVGTGVGTQNALGGNNTINPGNQTSSGHHTGPTPLAEATPGSTLGDKLHGVERNRGVAGSTGFPNEQPGEHDAQEFRKQQAATAAATQYGGHSTTTTGHHDDTPSHGTGLTGSGNQHAHHTGKDSAIVGGGAVGAHEYEKHHDHEASNQQSGLPGRHYDSANTQSSGIGGSHKATGLGSGQASGLRESEYNNSSSNTGGLTSGSQGLNENTTAHDGSLVGGGSSGLGSDENAALGTSGYGDSARSDGRNRLHKDPPASHPASQGVGSGVGNEHVPSGGEERRGVMDRGRGELVDDTGVGNSHATNPATNY